MTAVITLIPIRGTVTLALVLSLLAVIYTNKIDNGNDDK